MRNLVPALLYSLLCLAVTVTARGTPNHVDHHYVAFGKVALPYRPLFGASATRLYGANNAADNVDTNSVENASFKLVAQANNAADHGETSESVVEQDMGLTASTSRGMMVRRSSQHRLLARLGGKRQATPPPSTRIIQATDNDAQAELDNDAIDLHALTKPLIDQAVWDKLQGDEFQRHPELLDGLSDEGELLARHDVSNEWINWKMHGVSGKYVESGDILVWTGTSTNKEAYGASVPWIKTRSLLPLSATEMVDLLMDSERVTTYNPWSMGRKDCWVAVQDPANPERQTKIVKNRVQPPLGAKPAVSVTLLHARQVAADGTWLVISRATGGNIYPEPDQDSVGQSDILMGTNLLQPVDADSCILTAVTHAYSAAVPGMLAERLGVKGAIAFVKDIRKLVVPAN